MATFSALIAAAGDDVFQNSSGAVETAASLVDATNEYYGLRFQNVTIPQGSTINSAVVSVMPRSNTADEPEHTFWADDVDNSAAWTIGGGGTNDVSGRTPTTATAVWSSTDLGATGTSRHDSVSLVSIVQEIIDRAGWVSGNSLSIIIQGGSNATRDLSIFFYDDSTTDCARLDIDYTAPSGGANPKGPLSNPFAGPFGGPI